jgi:protoporphyrinogen/coproporphyrinogen III oxidase
MAKRVAIIGGGISGLCVAYRLWKSCVDFVLFEKHAEVGGNIKTNIHNGFLYESGPNSTLTSPELIDLIEDLGLTSQIAAPRPRARRRFIVRGGRLVALPSGPIGLISTTAFSPATKLSLIKEPFRRNRGDENESAASFFERRLGREVVDYAVDPFISGIYAGDSEKLAIEYAFPRLFEMERDFGSIVMGTIRSSKDKSSSVPKGTPRSLSFTRGMQTLVDALKAKLGNSVRTNCGDLKIDRAVDGRIEITSANGRDLFEAVVICTPAYVASDLVDGFDPELARELAGIYYPPVSVVYTGHRQEDVGRKPDGFGFLVPGVEKREILGSLWTSSIFAGRAPEGHHLFTTFIGGSRNPELGHSSEDELMGIAMAELKALMKVTGEPVFSAVKKWPRAIPQYNIGYGSVIDAIERFREDNPDLFLCGNYYQGISVSDCVKNGRETANEVARYLETRKA